MSETTKSKDEQRAELIVKRDLITEEVTGIEREQRRLDGVKRDLVEQAAALSDQIDELAPTTNECVGAYIASQEKAQEEKRVRQAETRARLATAGLSPEDVAEVAEAGIRRRR